MVHRMSWIEESSVYQAAVRRGQAEGRSLGLAEGREAGREEGREEGRVEGQAREARRLLLRLGTLRFGHPPSAVERAIEAAVDVEVLERMAEGMFTASSWDDVMGPLSEH